MRKQILILAALGAGLAWSAEPPAAIAERNARQAAEAMRRGHRVTLAWLERADPVTGLLPRMLTDPNWVIQDSAADLYPFLVLESWFTDPELHAGRLRYLLRQEVLYSTRSGRLSGDVLAGGKGFVKPEFHLDEIMFGSSEYVKDGLIPITELLGETPWYHRMRGLATAMVEQAPYRTRRGRIPAQTAEVNGNLLQALSRLAWRTGDPAYVEQVATLADFYFLDVLPSTHDLPPHSWDVAAGKPLNPSFRFSDHGNEIVGGLAEAYLLVQHRQPERAKAYREPFVRMIDRLLETGRNADKVWIMNVDILTLKPLDTRHVHCWGYLYNPVYTAWLLTGETRFRDAVAEALDSVARNPHYLFDEAGGGRKWGANAYSDSIESALVLLNRIPHAGLEAALDAAMEKYFARQREDGIIEGWYGDGNYIRTALMYALWKTQGASLRPWTPQVRLGAARASGGLVLHAAAESPWRGRLHFDVPRHRLHWHLPVNYPRLNEFPEWFTVEPDLLFEVRVNGGAPRRYLGAELAAGLPWALDGGERMTIEVTAAGEPPYGGRSSR